MMPLWASVVISLFILLFTIAIFAMCLTVWGMLLIRLAYSFRHLKTIFGTILAILFFGSFTLVFGVGAYTVSSMVIDGLIARFVVLLG